MSIRITTLGALHVAVDGSPNQALLAQRLRCALLVYLAVEREATRDQLVGLLWPDRDPEKARHTLSQALYELRGAVGDAAVESRGDVVAIAADAEIDAILFEDAAERGDHAAALALYQGPFLDGVYLADTNEFETWVDGTRARLARLQRRSRRELIEERTAGGDLKGALAAARAGVELDPLDDEAQHSFIELLARTGQRSLALRQYEDYERLLARELEVEPLDETRALVASIRAGELDGGARDGATADAVGTVPPAGETRAAASDPAPAGPEVVPTAAGAPEAGAPAPAPPVGPVESWIRSLPRVAALVGLVLVLGVTVWLVTRRDLPAVTTAGLDPQRIAVLYFDDHSADGSLRDIADGLTEELIHQLSQVPSLEIASRNGVKIFRDRQVSYDSIVKVLDVGTIVEGSVSSSGDRLRVTVQMIDAATNAHITSEVIERPDGDVLDLLEDVGAEISRMLRRTLGEQIRLRQIRAGTDDQEAWRLVQAAERERTTAREVAGAGDATAAGRAIERAEALLERAQQADDDWLQPVLMRGWLALDRVDLRLVEAAASGEGAADYGSALDRALTFGQRARRMAPDDASTHHLLGAVRYRQWELGTAEHRAALLDSAEHHLRIVATEDFANAAALNTLAKVLNGKGEFAEAKVVAERAYDRDAFLADADDLILGLAQAHLNTGDYRGAMEWCDEGLRRFPGDRVFHTCALTALASGLGDWVQPDSAWRHADAVVELSPPDRRAYNRAVMRLQVARVLARTGHADSARAVMRSVLDSAPTEGPGLMVPYYEAAVRLPLGESDSALRALSRFLAHNPAQRAYLAEDPWFQQLWDDPRFRQLVRKP